MEINHKTGFKNNSKPCLDHDCWPWHVKHRGKYHVSWKTTKHKWKLTENIPRTEKGINVITGGRWSWTDTEHKLYQLQNQTLSAVVAFLSETFYIYIMMTQFEWENKSFSIAYLLLVIVYRIAADNEFNWVSKPGVKKA